jgi:hypothetical protein
MATATHYLSQNYMTQEPSWDSVDHKSGTVIYLSMRMYGVTKEGPYWMEASTNRYILSKFDDNSIAWVWTEFTQPPTPPPDN